MAPSRLVLQTAARVVRAGGLIAYPTEGVWGLGCAPHNGHACERLLRLKQRDPAKGLILIASQFEQLIPYLAPVPPEQLRIAQDSWPGPNTWLFPAGPDCPDWVRGAHPTVAVRVTAHPIAAGLCTAVGGALISTSANRSGRPPARSSLALRLQMGADVDLIVSGALGGQRGPSTIRHLQDGRILRG